MRSSVIQGRFPKGIMAGAVIQRHGGGEAFQVPAAMAARLAGGIAGGIGGQPLPPAIQRHMEGVVGAPLGDVRVRVGPEASALGAVAFTMGSTIHFAPGRYDPSSRQGLQLLGHELAHVVQQRQGRVPNPFGSGIAVVSDRALEAQADAIGIKAAMAASTAPPLQMKAGPVPMRPGMAGGGQVAQPFYGLGALVGYAMPALSYVGSTIAAHPYLSATAAGVTYDYFKTWMWGKRQGPDTYQFQIVYFSTGTSFKDPVGHVAIRYEWPRGRFILAGLSPADSNLETWQTLSCQGKIYNDATELGRNPSADTYYISKDRMKAVAARIASDRQRNDLKYSILGRWPLGQSCASWAVQIANIAGVPAGSAIDRYLVSIPHVMRIYSGQYA